MRLIALTIKNRFNVYAVSDKKSEFLENVSVLDVLKDE